MSHIIPADARRLELERPVVRVIAKGNIDADLSAAIVSGSVCA